MSEASFPKSWVLTNIDSVSLKCEQRTPNDDESFIYVDIGSVDRDLKTIAEPQHLFGKEAPSRARKVINFGDVLVSLTRPNLNAVAYVDKKYDGQIASTGFEVIKPLINSKYIFGLVRSRDFIESISEKVQGALYPAAKSSDVREFEFGLPPLAEQQQIAQKLDELLAQVDTLKTRLDAIPNILKRFRQSVLAAAVSGRLTEEWRVENNAPLWRNVLLDEISTFQNGFAFKSEWFSSVGECQVMKLGNIKNDGLRFEASPAFVDNHTAELHKKYKPDYEDILITMTGTKYKRDYGFTCIVPKNAQILINQRVGRIISDRSQVMPRYLLIFLQSKIFLDEFFKGETGGVNQGNVGSEHIKSCSVALPLLEEQTEIVRRVEQLFAFADQIEQRVKDAQARVNHLTQSILAKAFRGELTADWRAQNPELISGENSAAALLERIKAEREATAKPKKKKA